MTRIGLMLFTVLFCGLTGRAQTPAKETETMLANLPYKTGAALTPYERERCKLDLYLPAGKTDFPVVVFFHGGGLTSGAKDDADNVAVAKAFAKNGIAAVVPNYRLSGQVKYPAYVEDAAAAVAWTREHIVEYGGAPNALFVSGHSAGGYLAAMVGMDPRWLKAYGLETTIIAGLVPISGQMMTHFTVRRERGIPNPEQTPVLDEAGPCNHVRKDAPPTLCIAGSLDMATRPEENRYFIAALKATGHPACEYQEYAGRDHGTTLTLLWKPKDAEMAAILQFIAKFTPKPVAGKP